MAKKRSYRKSTKVPEPINTIFDLAGALVMSAIAASKENKYHYTAKGKINPYAASAVGLATGRMNSTRSILQTGAFLGAMGSFDVEADKPRSRRYIPDDPVLSQIRETRVNDNRYAWRLNCDEGFLYGVSPYDYESHEEYKKALQEAKKNGSIEYSNDTKADMSLDDVQKIVSSYICCRVSRLDNGSNEYYISSDSSIKVGDIITVQTDNGETQCVVIMTKNLDELDENEIPKEVFIISSQNDEDS